MNVKKLAELIYARIFGIAEYELTTAEKQIRDIILPYIKKESEAK